MKQGHKRWEKAVLAGYESVRRLTHEYLLPALERFVALTSRLRGLSKFHVSDDHIGLTTRDLDSIMDVVSCLQLIAHQVLVISGSELRQFQAFSVWLRQEIDIQASGTNSSEGIESGMSIDHASTLEYIQGAMVQSALNQFLDLGDDVDEKEKWDLAAEGDSLFDLYRVELNRLRSDNQNVKQFPRLDAIISHLDTQCSTVFRKIAEKQRRNVRIGPSIKLGKGASKLMDMRMLVEVSHKIDIIEHRPLTVIVGQYDDRMLCSVRGYCQPGEG